MRREKLRLLYLREGWVRLFCYSAFIIFGEKGVMLENKKFQSFCPNSCFLGNHFNLGLSLSKLDVIKGIALIRSKHIRKK